MPTAKATNDMVMPNMTIRLSGTVLNDVMPLNRPRDSVASSCVSLRWPLEIGTPIWRNPVITQSPPMTVLRLAMQQQRIDIFACASVERYNDCAESR